MHKDSSRAGTTTSRRCSSNVELPAPSRPISRELIRSQRSLDMPGMHRSAMRLLGMCEKYKGTRITILKYIYFFQISNTRSRDRLIATLEKTHYYLKSWGKLREYWLYNFNFTYMSYLKIILQSSLICWELYIFYWFPAHKQPLLQYSLLRSSKICLYNFNVSLTYFK